ncbi:hypothetical protein BKA00_005386 [Actinomadura coerulea]|uniref:Uncharacterized protein n=1 Tax=Actinomadura coerulea TaxID=46159 RepID=A0A7X0G2Z9_9ACTN|nr:EcsC family protein [Actinomadura coerulea]MBB6398472.1 hypothetical protein [Actinomadura coerulea]GGQ09537.1 hypothetical protein GCM10010187_26920 [Actinomadura coerulea]
MIADGEAGKVAAYAKINKLVQALARRATWEQLNHNVVIKVVQKVFARFGFTLTKKKLGQVLPVIGIAFGAGANTIFLKRITDDAEHLYRERFLRERYGIEAEPDLVTTDADSREDVVMVEIVDAGILGEDNERERDDPMPATEGDERG